MNGALVLPPQNDTRDSLGWELRRDLISGGQCQGINPNITNF